MSKSLLGISMDVVNGIWSVGAETYKVVKNEVNDAIDNEAEARTQKLLGDHSITKNSIEYRNFLAIERKKVEKDAKELAIKGGLLAIGLGFFF